MIALARRHWKRLVMAGLLGFLALNGVAYMHAHKMSHFVSEGKRPLAPEFLSSGEKLQALLTGIRVPRPENDTTPGDLGLDCETHRIATADGLELEVWRVLAPEPRGNVLLFHGYASSKASLLDEAKFFLGQGWNTILVDFRGSGESDGSHTSLGWHESRDVQAAVQLVRESGGDLPLCLYGMSMGAVSILRAADQNDLPVDGLILEAPFNSLLDTTVNRFHQMGLPGFPFAHTLLFWGGLQSDFDAFEHRPERYIGSVECPAWVLFGRDDPHITEDNRDALVLGASASVRFETLPAGHSPLLRTSPDEWRALVATSLEELLAR